MSATKHTPGPRRFIKRNGMPGRSHPYCIAASFYSTPGLTSGQDSVAEVVSGPEHSEANARLIAAAPALLDALESLDAALNLDGLANQFPSAEEPVNKIKAAIRLAKGDSL